MCAKEQRARGDARCAPGDPGEGRGGGAAGEEEGDLVESPERVRGEVRTPGRYLERQRGLSGASSGDVELCRSLSGH